MRRGILLESSIGVGDAVQFTSLPENFFRAKGYKLVDVGRHWVFDHNPFIDREHEANPDLVHKLWNHRPFVAPVAPDYMSDFEARSRISTFLSNAEIHARLLGVPVTLNRPRLYQFEDFPFEERTKILLHTRGRSHGDMPYHVVDHVLKKYGHIDLCHLVADPSEPDLGIPRFESRDLWTVVKFISEARMFIGVDSGPSWIAACYPDIVTKRVRVKPDLKRLADWVPLDFENNHSHWDDRAVQIFNTSEDDVGFTSSYRRI